MSFPNQLKGYYFEPQPKSSVVNLTTLDLFGANIELKSSGFDDVARSLTTDCHKDVFEIGSNCQLFEHTSIRLG